MPSHPQRPQKPSDPCSSHLPHGGVRAEVEQPLYVILACLIIMKTINKILKWGLLTSTSVFSWEEYEYKPELASGRVVEQLRGLHDGSGN